MKTKVSALFAIFILSFSPKIFSWGRHDIITNLAIENIHWLNKFNKILPTPFEKFLEKAFSKNFTPKDFLKQYQLNPAYEIKLKEALHSVTSGSSILITYSDEPDWGMDQNLAVSADQKFMGGTKGPTSQAFRHLYWKKWSLKAPWRTFHIPPREMGEALKRAQMYYDLAQMAYEAKEAYWAFRFLAWSLHYIQDMGQPFHSTQILTPRFIAWDAIFALETLIKRTTQIIANYHFIYEDYVVYRLEKEIANKDVPFLTLLLRENTFMYSSSAYLIAKHSADTSNRLSYEIGEASFTFFGQKFLDPKIDVPNSPKATFPPKDFDDTSSLTPSKKRLFLKNTAKSLQKTGFFTRSLLELAKEEILKKN